MSPAQPKSPPPADRPPTAAELVLLLRAALPMHWESQVRSLGLSPGLHLPPEELARVTEKVF
jgi:hypothetical protein